MAQFFLVYTYDVVKISKGPATQNAVCRSGLRSLSAADCGLSAADCGLCPLRNVTF